MEAWRNPKDGFVTESFRVLEVAVSVVSGHSGVLEVVHVVLGMFLDRNAELRHALHRKWDDDLSNVTFTSL